MKFTSQYISVEAAAHKLNISRRAIQLRCKKIGIFKQGKEYLINIEIFNNWKNKSEILKTSE